MVEPRIDYVVTVFGESWMASRRAVKSPYDPSIDEVRDAMVRVAIAYLDSPTDYREHVPKTEKPRTRSYLSGSRFSDNALIFLTVISAIAVLATGAAVLLLR